MSGNGQQMTREEALQVIRDNPGCVAVLDNDNWHVRKKEPPDLSEWPEDRQDEWWDSCELIDSYDVEDCDYGGGLVEVLILGFDMSWESV